MVLNGVIAARTLFGISDDSKSVRDLLYITWVFEQD